jgi:hypothetical protein
MLTADGEGGHVDAGGKDRRGDVFLRLPSRNHGEVHETSPLVFIMSLRLNLFSSNHTGAGEGRFL